MGPMTDTTPTGSFRSRLGAALRIAYTRFIWLLVLVPILGVSAYSYYWVARHFGVPPGIAIFFSTCYDGAALVGADYSLKYAQKGMSGSKPRAFVNCLALVSAFLQTFHARLAGEPPGAWIMWASLPVIAVVLYDIHIHYERRKAQARSGSIYPSPLPKYGIVRWFLFPLGTLSDLRDIIVARSRALQTVALTLADEFQREARSVRNVRERIEPAPADPALEPAELQQERMPDVVPADVLKQHRAARQTAPRDGTWEAHHKPHIHIREWALDREKYRGRVGRRGPIPDDIKEDYYNEHPDERSG
jgi:hypothetical protein